MGTAYELSKASFASDYQHILALYNYFVSEIVTRYPVILNGDKSNRVPHNLSLTFKDFNANTLISHLHDFAFSLGSACQSGSNRPSHVLMAIGHTHLQANNTIRISLGRFTTKTEVTKLITAIKELIDS